MWNRARPQFLEAIAARKRIVIMNAELDATLGPILKVRADGAGAILSNADGDEPGIAPEFDPSRAAPIGYRPVMAGNIKGFLDRYRTAETQRGFAKRTRPKRGDVRRLRRWHEIEF